MGDFPFYGYKTRKGKQVLSNLYEGFFPSQLKEKYPDGVFIEPFDQSKELFIENEDNDLNLMKEEKGISL